MRNVILRRLRLENFKGVSLAEFAFDDKYNNIVGANGAGKTSLYDAYMWLLLGEDSSGSHLFKVQPLDSDGNLIPKVKTDVSSTISFDGAEHDFRRTLNQKWTKPRGTNQEYLKSTESIYEIDGVPIKESDYRSKIKELFQVDDYLRLLSSVYSFNRLDMGEKRKRLIEMAGEMPEIINEKDYPHLYPEYIKYKDLNYIKDRSRTAIRELEKKKSDIPGRISENELDLVSDVDFDALRKEENDIEIAIGKVDSQMTKTSSSRSTLFDSMQEEESKLKSLESELLDIESSISRERNRKIDSLRKTKQEITVKYNDCSYSLSVSKRELNSLIKERDSLKEQRDDLIKQWKERNSEVFSFESDSVCPTCKRPFSEEELTHIKAEAVRVFNTGKAAVLKRITSEGENVTSRLKEVINEIEALNEKINGQEVSLAGYYEELNKSQSDIENVPSVEDLKSFSKEYQKVLNKRNDARQAYLMSSDSVSSDIEPLKEKKEQLQSRLKEVVRLLSKENDNKKVIERRKELQEELASCIDSLSDLEAIMYEIGKYEKAYIYAVEEKVSSLFSFVRWQLYEPNLTNEGEKKKCECLVDGIPYSSNLNTASRINAGIDIVNGISKYLGVSVPLWIDGKESICNLIDTNSQIISLTVKDNSRLELE